MKILATGLSGMVGSALSVAAGSSVSWENLSLETGVDITNYSQLKDRIQSSACDTILHLAAKTDVDACEEEKDLGKQSGAWKVNVQATEYLVDLARQYDKFLLYVSTDFVFDGQAASYDESSSPNPINWYGKTKYEGEKLVQSLDSHGCIVRIAFPYGASIGFKKDFITRMKDYIASHTEITAPSDQLITPTHVGDIYSGILALIQVHESGIYHCVGSESISPSSLAGKLIEAMKIKVDVVQTTKDAYYNGRAPRPSQLVIRNDKIRKLSLEPRTVSAWITQTII